MISEEGGNSSSMGLYLHTYLGPYISFKYRDATHSVQVFGCTNSECPEFVLRVAHYRNPFKFCSRCASPMGPSEKIVPFRPPYTHVLAEFEDTLTSVNPHVSPTGGLPCYLGSNRRRDKSKRSYHPDPEGCHEDLSGIDPKAEIEEFKEEFAEELQALRKTYDDVQVLWGLHLYYH